MDVLSKIKDIVYECAYINPTDIDFSSKVRDICISNGCGKYNTSWTCPPGVGELKDLIPKCLKYNNAVVFTSKGDIEDSFDFEGMLECKKKHEIMQQKVIDILAFKHSLVLGAGCCTLCPKCAYPKPCRHPDKAYPSMESYGINVLDISKKTNIHYNNGPNTVTYFSIIFY